ncbi:hypothetical protein Tcan_06546 [Toxocara canis]|uniref:Uncharacterized protein n=1 Tax=Toxocara canis TaxID=6265 RepID=A0A0B2VAU0_TOXCA|nr:hypothetical protein Tcan_06546 [Toxocara canis]
MRRFSSEPPPHKTPKGMMGRYEHFLKTRAPKAYTVHRMVVDGSKWCVTDIKIYFKIKRDLANGTRTLSQLTQNELEILIQTSEEMAKMIIVLILIPLPMTFYFLGAAL